MDLELNDFEEVVCPECGNDALSQCFKLYRLSPLKSPDGLEYRKALHVYACASCYTEISLPNIDTGEYEQENCSCGKDLFCQYSKLLKLSSLKSKTGKDEYRDMFLYACVSCAKIHNLPEQDTEEGLI